MTGDPQFGVGDIWARIGRLVAGSMSRAMIAITIVLGCGILIDSGTLSERDATSLNVVFSFGIVFLQYWLLATLLDDLNLRRSSAGRVVGYFVLGIVATMGILLGFALLVVPGLILAVRWSLAGVVLVGSDAGVVEAMGESWRVTGPRFWTILAAILTVYVPALAVAIGGFVIGEMQGMGMIAATVANIGFVIWCVLGCYLNVAIYSLVAAPGKMAAIFA